MRAHRNALLLALSFLPVCSRESDTKPALVTTDAAKDLKNTIVTAHLREKHQPGKNLLWCATFQLAWDELSGILKGPVQLKDEPEMAAVLNARLVTKGDLDDASYVARAGFGKDRIVEAIREELNRKFSGAAAPLLVPDPQSLRPQDIVAYAYLVKNLTFRIPLLHENEINVHFMGTPVRTYGLWWEEGIKNKWRDLTQEISILDYQSNEDFVLELIAGQEMDRLILSRLAPGATLQETITRVTGRISVAKPTGLEIEEEFMAPCLNFDLSRNFYEIIGKPIVNPNFDEYFIKSARQNIRFTLDENGAVLKSEASLGAASAPPKKPRRFILDGPFLILMMRKGAKMPYFALWVENPELLVPAN